MKKIFIIGIIVLVICMCCSCSTIEFNSLLEYTERVENSGGGYSSLELDRAREFLPSQTFISSYKYEDGSFHIYESYDEPSKSFLRLKYETSIYIDAKKFMIENIPQYGDSVYEYNEYIFYQNDNFVKSQKEDNFPRWFTMACYNDVKCELIFIGFFTSEKIEVSPEEWTEFIDKYYGEYHDFSK